MNEQDILNKLTSICAKSEQCPFDLRKKMKKWEVDEDTQVKIISYLKKENYINEHRYAEAFIRNKVEYNKWGRYKIEQALRFKLIPKEIYGAFLDDISDDKYEDILLPLLRKKLKLIKYNSAYEAKTKLLRFALQRGFTMEQILNHIDSIIKEDI